MRAIVALFVVAALGIAFYYGTVIPRPAVAVPAPAVEVADTTQLEQAAFDRGMAAGAEYERWFCAGTVPTEPATAP